MNKFENCKYCNTKLIKNQIFCSSSCAAKYNNAKRKFNPKLDKRIKYIPCKKCQKLTPTNIRSSKVICLSCKQLSTFCRVCGQHKCTDKKVCDHFRLFPSLIKYFGFNEDVIGTKEVYKEFYRIRSLIEEEYIDNELSLLDLAKKYNHGAPPNLDKILNVLQIKKRTISKATKLAILNGKVTPIGRPRGKHGYYTTWNKKKIFYRSSYELEFAKLLDSKKINYEVESLRLLYWDSVLESQRIAIPDFYLPDTNTIIEIKSTYTYNEQNMNDKIKAYKSHGYNVELFIDKNWWEWWGSNPHVSNYGFNSLED